MITIMEKKFDFYVKKLPTESFEKKIIAMLRAFCWFQHAVEQDEATNDDKCQAFLTKINSKDTVATMFQHAKQ